MSKIIELSAKELRKLQLIEFEMLVEVDRICKKHGIKYSLDGGTLLGAVRHKGFIPWDDDLDVMFLHEEYEKFFRACQTDLDSNRFFFQDYRTDPGYRWGYGKMRRIGSEYIKSGQEHLKQKTGICIDIFDFESVPDGEIQRRRFERQMFCIRKILYSAAGRKNEKKLLMRIWYSVLYLIPSSFVHKVKNSLTRRFNAIQTKNVLCLMWPVKNYPYGFSRELFSDYVELDFEGIKAMAIKGYDEYLHMKYGDYMTLPPIEKRRGVMDAVEYRFVDVDYEQIIETWKKN